MKAMTKAERESIPTVITDIPRRLLRMTTLALLYLIIEMVGKLLILIQLGFVLWRRRPHLALARFAGTYSSWMGAVWAYVTFASDCAPWPFSVWPSRSAEK
ncbi:MAG: hypothetical protein ACI9DC_005535 [Gammaproteobacteria bacterium]|jgi:hypothetical protein